MESKKQNRSNSKSRLTQGLLAATVAALVVMPVTFAGASGGPVATKSASLIKQIKSLKRRVTALEAKQTITSSTNTSNTTTTTGAPSGPAAGDLTGTYPNPTIGPDKVTSTKVAPHTLTAEDIADQTLGGFQIAPDSLFAEDLGYASVGASEFKDPFVVHSGGIFVPKDESRNQSVTCPNGQMISGGYAWVYDQAGTSIIASAPNENAPSTTWDVVGRSQGVNNTLYAWALCLPF